MVSRWAVIESGVVTNVVRWDGDAATWQPPEGHEMVPLTDEHTVSPGDVYDGRRFTPGSPPATNSTLPVAVDPAVIATLLTQAQSATTVAATRNVLTALLRQLDPSA